MTTEECGGLINQQSHVVVLPCVSLCEEHVCTLNDSLKDLKKFFSKGLLSDSDRLLS